MRKNFTRLVCVGIASFCMMSVFGQGKMSVERRIIPSEKVKLRTGDETEYWWPDSIITYDSAGEPTEKIYYDKESRTSTYFTFQNGIWNASESVNTNGYMFAKPKVGFYALADGRRSFSGNGLNLMFWWTYNADLEFNSMQDGNGNLVLAEVITKNPINGTYKYAEFRIKYNDRNEPVLVERYNYNTLKEIIQFNYDEKGHQTLLENMWIDSETQLPIIIDSNWKVTAKYDEEGKPVEIRQYRGNTSSEKWLLEAYYNFYYSDGAYIPNVAVVNNNPIGTNNLGNFDVNVNIPTDSISNGSITITFPEGFTIDTKNTKLTVDFTALFTLTVTKQENYSWLLEIKPKTLRSASLRAGEAKKMLQVAYTVDAKKKKGTYDISVNSILFETKGGNYYPEPAITVPAVVNRWGVGIETVENGSVWTSGENLYVRTAKACTVSVYTLPGQLIRQQAVGAGETAIPLPQGIYFVKTGDMTRKIFVK